MIEKIENINIEANFVNKIIEQLPNILFQFTVTPDFDFQFDYMNGPFYDFYELSVQDVIDNPINCVIQRVHPEDISKFNNSIISSFKSLERWEIIYRVYLPKKGLKWIKASAKTEKLLNGNVTFYGIKSDITELKNSQYELKISDARSQFANMASNVGVWDWNLVTNKVFYSKESLKILELETDSDIVDNPEKWDDQVHPDDREAYFGNIKLHFEDKIPYYETVHRILCNGKYKWILDRGKVIKRDTTGNPLRIIGTHTDVTFQKHKEAKLEETLHLVNNQKNKLLNFAHIVSHNLRNHTGNLSALIEMKETEMLSTDEFASYLKVVSGELTNSIKNLEELVKVQDNVEIKITELNVHEYLEKTFSILFDDINKTKANVINNVPTDFSVHFNPAYLESVLLNLTSNALKYSNPAVETIIEFSVDYIDNYKVLIVKDNGLGIDLIKNKDAIFGLYKTFHLHSDSRGIGLYLTKNQLESFNGKIEVESIVNQGSTFNVFFNEEF